MIKVSLLVSGQIRGRWKSNLNNLSHCLQPNKTYTSTWSPSNEDVNFKFIEPEMVYHPVIDTEPYPTFKAIEYKKRCQTDYSLRLKTKHRTKQILQHNLLMQKIEPCDVVIRTRYDCVISNEIDWNSCIKKSFDENCALGFGTRTSRWSTWKKILEIPKFVPPENKKISGRGLKETNDWAYYLMDTLIIHPYKLWNCEKVKNLHDNKKLKAAEWGWYQILSNADNHYSYYGGCQMQRLI